MGHTNSEYRFLLYVFLVAVILAPSPSFGGAYGSFSASPDIRLEGKRWFKLRQKYEYYDPDGVTWQVPKGFITDGASIPRWLWPILGPPMGGEYRDAAIIHDYFCQRRYPDWELVHKTFHTAMLAKGVSEAKAWVMYQGVYRFGPRWASPELPTHCRPGVNFKPKKCIMNNEQEGGIPLKPLHEFNRANAQTFLSDIRAKGYYAEAAVLAAVPDIRSILED